eukprot:2856-Eustigmatos_ZCMA.PRE.1
MKQSPTEVTGTPEEYDAAPIVEIGQQTHSFIYAARQACYPAAMYLRRAQMCTCVTFGSDPVPKGFRKLSRTPFGR